VGERNCWMCRWATKGGGCFPESDMAPGTNDWIEDHCTEHDLMPPKDSPPCPTWASINPADVEAATLRAAWAAVGVVWGEDGRPVLPGIWFWNGTGEAISQPRRGVEIVCCVGYRDAVTAWNAANDCDPRESEEAPAAVVLACIADAQVAALGVRR